MKSNGIMWIELQKTLTCLYMIIIIIDDELKIYVLILQEMNCRCWIILYICILMYIIYTCIYVYYVYYVY